MHRITYRYQRQIRESQSCIFRPHHTSLDSSREIVVTRCKILSKLATTMLERTVLKPVLTEIGSFPVPNQCGGAMEGTVVVVMVQDTLYFLA